MSPIARPYLPSATFSRKVKGHRRDGVPQNPEDWLMRLCKRLKTLSFTVN
jgi:hypothetical protein